MIRWVDSIRVVADKSLTHRAAILALLSRGRTVVRRPNLGEDCACTLRAVAALGARVVETDRDRWILEGDGVPREPEDVLDLGNSGTGMRLLAGVAAGLPGLTVLTGDGSLRSRPMHRIAAPLREMGAGVELREGGRAPLAVRGGNLRPIDHASPVASAQVKSCLLLAGLSLAEGELSVREPIRSRDHTERLLAHLGAPIEVEAETVRLRAGARLRGTDWTVPGDVSAAAFFLVATALSAGSRLTVEDVGLNPTRSGALEVLRRMGADLEVVRETEAPEPMGRIRIAGSRLRGTIVEEREIPSLIDEIPILAVAAAGAEGETVFHGVGELRHKESDRVGATLDLLHVLGVRAEARDDRLRIEGGGDPGRRAFRGGTIAARGDHRIAMSALVAGLFSDAPIEVDSLAMIATSDPGFSATLERLSRGGER